MKSRGYQRRAVRRSLQAAPGQRLLLVGPTGCGKTVIAVDVIRRHLRRGRRILFLAHAQTIIEQTYDHLIELGLKPEDVGVLMATDAAVKGHRERIRPDAPIQIAGILTVTRRDFVRADVVFVDEAHHAAAETYTALLAQYPNAIVYGLTATPHRMDGKGLRDCFDELYVIASASKLIAQGFLAAPIVYSKPDGFRDARVRRVKTVGRDYAVGELGRAMNHRRLVGNIITEWKRLGRNRATVVFASSIPHSKTIAARFNAAGVKAEHIDESTHPNERKAILGRLNSGATKVVCNYGVLGEGWDQPAVKCVVLARPTKSLTVYLQQAGRTLRPYKRQRPIVLDHAGNALRFGLPQMEREHSLDGVPKMKGNAPVKVCTECEALIPASARECPECGHEFPRVETPEEAEAKLERVHGALRLARISAFAKRRHLGDAWLRAAVAAQIPGHSA